MDILIANMTERFWELLSKKLSSEANEAELGELQEILSRNPDLRNAAETLSLLENQSLPVESDSETELAFERHISRLAESEGESSKLYPLFFSNEEVQPRKGRNIRRWSISILVILVIASGLFILRNNEVSRDTAVGKHAVQSQVTTKPGSKTHIQL